MTQAQTPNTHQVSRQVLASLYASPKSLYVLSREGGHAPQYDDDLEYLFEKGLIGESRGVYFLMPSGRTEALAVIRENIEAEYAARSLPLPTDRTPSLEHARSQRRAEPNKD